MPVHTSRSKIRTELDQANAKILKLELIVANERQKSIKLLTEHKVQLKRLLFATVPIIALTALAMADDRERCLEAGATEYLSKPLKMRRLAALITRLLNVKA